MATDTIPTIQTTTLLRFKAAMVWVVVLLLGAERLDVQGQVSQIQKNSIVLHHQSTQSTQSENGSPLLSQYILSNWAGDEGLPSSGILSALQTKDGYMWFTTHNGLVRFDGKAFTVFNQSNTKEIQSTVFQELCEDRDGNMWIATNGSGLLRYHDGKFTAFNPTNTPLFSTTFIEALCLDKAGKIWVGFDKGLLYAVPAEGFSLSKNLVFQEQQEFRGIHIISIFEDSHSVIWITTQSNGVYRISNGIVEHLDAVTPLVSQNKALYDIAETPDSTIWIAAVEKGLIRYSYSTGEFSLFTGTPESRIIGNVYSLGTDKRGILWIGSDRALYRYEHGVLSGLTSERKLHNAKVYEDNEKNLWFPTYRHGLSMLREGKFTMFGMQEGISDNIIHCVKPLPDGTVVIGSESGLNLLSGNTVEHITKESGHLPNNTVRDVLRDKNNTLWIGTHGGLVARTGEGKKATYRTFTTNDGLANNQVRTILQDKRGNYWFGTLRGLTFVPASSVPTMQTGRFGADARTYLAGEFVNALFEAQNGDIYVSTVGVGLYIISPNGTMRHYTNKDGLASLTITRIMQEDNGTLWICTNAGITKFTDGTFRNYTAEDGLPNHNYYQILPDSLGNFWCATSNGILKIPRQDFYDVEQRKRAKLRMTVYKKADGLRENECTGNGHGCTDAYGRLWFATIGGAARLSPRTIPINTTPPPVYIERLALDETFLRLDTMTSTNAISIPNTTRTLSLFFTALSYSAPNNVRFRVLLEGFDKSWYEVDKRDVYYTNLPRGKTYIFRVQACNNDGLWNERGAALELYCEPFFWETWWFYGLCICLFLTMGYQGVRWRVRRLRAKADQLTRTVQARTSELRVANEEISRQMLILDERSREIELTNTQLQQSYENLSVLSEIGQKIASALDVTTIGNRIFKTINALLDAPVLVICIHNTEKHELEYSFLMEEGVQFEPFVISMTRHDIPAVQCVAFGKEVVIVNEEIPIIVGAKVKSLVYLPMIADEYVIGAFSVQRFNGNAFSQYDLNILRTIAPYIAAALKNAKSYAQIENALETLRRTQTQLAQAEKMASLGTLVAGVAHELNTPIGVAVTAASTLDVRTKDFVKRYQEGGLKKSELDAYVQTAQMGADLTLRNLERAANLIQSFKQVAVDQTTDNKRRIGVKNYIAGIITSLEPKWKTTRHRVELVCDETLEMETYPGAIAQIITNLIDNSLLHGFQGYTEEGIMRITVEHQATSNQVTITYSDNGKGIPPEVLPRIFDPFFTTKQAQGGTGLGMHIVYNLVTQKLGGEIVCQTTNTSGAEFRLVTPLVF